MLSELVKNETHWGPFFESFPTESLMSPSSTSSCVGVEGGLGVLFVVDLLDNNRDWSFHPTSRGSSFLRVRFELGIGGPRELVVGCGDSLFEFVFFFFVGETVPSWGGSLS